jgi:hypothetical protein
MSEANSNGQNGQELPADVTAEAAPAPSEVLTPAEVEALWDGMTEAGFQASAARQEARRALCILAAAVALAAGLCVAFNVYESLAGDE